MEKIIKINKKVDSKGHIKLDIPTDYSVGQPVEMLIIINSGRVPQKINFANIIGKLKWEGDPVQEQNEIRNEWT